ncbi:threonylcarbamoyladenosine tRNA methylthiotransferase-like [Durio zibethinus]|uniref:Threonylcarbamoyladenosine tRNA methylthiotransferase-like n=1 Tax=Durio zibethinus TaxID=66656 RepID=A0A6P6B5N9_DURZI|nr:threonylcarbamoyladenosine tRNA methylthiotransferase-like [Durio zibethinus]
MKRAKEITLSLGQNTWADLSFQFTVTKRGRPSRLFLFLLILEAKRNQLSLPEKHGLVCFSVCWSPDVERNEQSKWKTEDLFVGSGGAPLVMRLPLNAVGSDGEYMAGQLSAFGYAIYDNPEEGDLWLIST